MQTRAVHVDPRLASYGALRAHAMPGAGNASDAVSEDQRRLLRAMAEPGATAKAEGSAVVVTTTNRGVSLARGRFDRAIIANLVSRNILAWRGSRSGAELSLTDEGASLLRQLDSAGPIEATATPTPEPARGASAREALEPAVKVNLRESPLEWLRRRQDGLLDDASYQAGERLRAEFERAGLGPRMSVDWSQPPQSGQGAGLNPTEAMIAARQRFNKAITAMGPDFGGVVTDICCYLKGLETVEQERRWPQRSAKVVLSMGLAVLARHYGLSSVATGAPNRDGIGVWRAPDAA